MLLLLLLPVWPRVCVLLGQFEVGSQAVEVPPVACGTPAKRDIAGDIGLFRAHHMTDADDHKTRHVLGSLVVQWCI
jgi:hypothetical protein